MKSKYDYPENYRYYDEGWNARMMEAPKAERATQDWFDGWNDCDEAFQANENPQMMD